MAKRTQTSKKRAAVAKRTARSPKTTKAGKRSAQRIAAVAVTAGTSRGKAKAAQPATPKSPKSKSARPPLAKAGRRTSAKSRNASARVRRTVDGYVATLNDWGKDCVAGLRTMIRKASPKGSRRSRRSCRGDAHQGPLAWIKAGAKHVHLGFWRNIELPDARKVLKGTGNKIRRVKLADLKNASKREWDELVRLASRLNELRATPARRPKAKAK